MRYAIINERVPKDSTHCTICPALFTTGYVRDLSTSLRYCGVDCLMEHIASSEAAFSCISVPRIEHRVHA